MNQAIILAGGKGTRLRSITGDDIPKPMAQVAGKPILQWQIESLRANGIKKIILIVGYLGNVIRNFFGDGSAFDVEISYFAEETPLGTAGALPLLTEYMDEDFVLVFGDVVFDVDLHRMEKFHKTKHSEITLFVHPNTHPFDSDIVITEEDGRVCDINSKHSIRTDWYDNCVKSGLYMVSRSFCKHISGGTKTDLEKDILRPLARSGGLVYAYSSPEYVKDVGTPERITMAEKEIRSGFVSKRCLKEKQKCIFLDRDGTINELRGLISKAEDLVLEAHAIEAIRLINASGYLAIVITNQPVVARGMCTEEDVNYINNKMKTLLGREGVYLDDVRFCPHHPDKGYPEENPVYKVVCECRKPKIGMITDCIQKYNIDIENSWMVGDTTTDVQTGINANMHTALVLTGEAGRDRKYPVEPDIVGENLLAVVKEILK